MARKMFAQEQVRVMAENPYMLHVSTTQITFTNAFKEDVYKRQVIICTQICPHAPTQPHEPVPFMGSPVDMATMNQMCIRDRSHICVT